jgi:hypothetical protein
MPILGSFGAGSSKGFGLTSGAGVDPVDFDYLVLAGGGAGQQGLGGGGGAGGHRTSFPGGTKVTVDREETTITVGAGGTGANPNPPSYAGGHGVDSSIGAYIVSAGGGAMNTASAFPATPADNPTNAAVRNGGSGAGQTHQQQQYTGLGNTPPAPGGPANPVQGYPGGPGGGSFGASGGGGAGGAGNNGTTPGNPTNNSGPGGPGVSNSITGSSVTRGGGGGGGPYAAGAGSGGSGGGGPAGTAGTDGLGGGGGGPPPGGTPVPGGNGIVIMRVPSANAPDALAVAPGSNTITDVGGDKLLTFNVTGTLTI